MSEISTPTGTTGAGAYTPTDRTVPTRSKERAAYDKEQVHAILDEGYVCHLGFVRDGAPGLLRGPEIALEQVRDVGDVLDGQWLVEAGVLAELRDDRRIRCGLLTERRLHGVRGDEVGQREGDERHPEHQEDRESEPDAEVARERVETRSRAGRRRCDAT